MLEFSTALESDSLPIIQLEEEEKSSYTHKEEEEEESGTEEDMSIADNIG